jgi:hypothetical protein
MGLYALPCDSSCCFLRRGYPYIIDTHEFAFMNHYFPIFSLRKLPSKLYFQYMSGVSIIHLTTCFQTWWAMASSIQQVRAVRIPFPRRTYELWWHMRKLAPVESDFDILWWSMNNIYIFICVCMYIDYVILINEYHDLDRLNYIIIKYWLILLMNAIVFFNMLLPASTCYIESCNHSPQAHIDSAILCHEFGAGWLLSPRDDYRGLC